jgi:plasmid stability protein
MRTPLGVVLLFALFRQAPAQSAKPEPVPGPDHAAPAEPAPQKGLLGIAEREAARSSKLLRDRILGSLRQWVLQHEGTADRGRSLIESVVNGGPDAAPVLLGFVNAAAAGQGEASIVQPAARALVGLVDRTHNEKLLHELAEATKGAPPAIRIDVLAAFETIDHRTVVDYAAPMLDDENPMVRVAAVRALGQQKSHAAEVAKLLRPQLQKEKGPSVDALRALHDLGDKQSVDLAQGVLGSSQDVQLVGVALRFVSDFGGKGALAPLELLLDPNRPSPFDDALLKQAVDAVQKIGLREIDAKTKASEILVNCMNKHPAPNVRDRACWQLGPYQSADALKRLEDPVAKDILANSKASPSRSNTNNFINLAEFRLRFEAWSKAMDALKKAKEEDDRGFRTSYIENLKAVAYCGLDKFEPARKILVETVSPEERMKLLSEYPILEKMARDSKYHDLFTGH